MPKHTGKILTNCAKELTVAFERKKKEGKMCITHSVSHTSEPFVMSIKNTYILHLVNSIYDDDDGDGKNTEIFFSNIFVENKYFITWQ